MTKILLSKVNKEKDPEFVKKHKHFSYLKVCKKPMITDTMRIKPAIMTKKRLSTRRDKLVESNCQEGSTPRINQPQQRVDLFIKHCISDVNSPDDSSSKMSSIGTSSAKHGIRKKYAML